MRIEFSGALYHVTTRGDRQEPIYEDDEDRVAFLHVLAAVVGRLHWICHAYCLMANHYHLVVETPDANLSQSDNARERLRVALLRGYTCHWDIRCLPRRR